MSFPMNAGLNDGFISDHSVEQRVRKAPEESPANAAAHERERKWRFRDEVNGCVHFGTELTAQPAALALVPPVRSLDIRRGCGPEDNEQRSLLEPLANL
jgi:hypothetical protein